MATYRVYAKDGRRPPKHILAKNLDEAKRKAKQVYKDAYLVYTVSKSGKEGQYHYF